MKKLMCLLVMFFVFTACTKEEVPENKYYGIESDKLFAYMNLGDTDFYLFDDYVKKYNLNFRRENTTFIDDGDGDYILLLPKNDRVVITFEKDEQKTDYTGPVVWRFDDGAKVTVSHNNKKQEIYFDDRIIETADLLNDKLLFDPVLFTDKSAFDRHVARMNYSSQELELLSEGDYINEDDRRLFLLTYGKSRLYNMDELTENAGLSTGTNLRKVCCTNGDETKYIVFYDNEYTGESEIIPLEYTPDGPDINPVMLENNLFLCGNSKRVAAFYNGDTENPKEIFAIRDTRNYKIINYRWNYKTGQLVVAYAPTKDNGGLFTYKLIVTDIAGNNPVEVETYIPVVYKDGEIAAPDFINVNGNQQKGCIKFSLPEKGEFTVDLPAEPKPDKEIISDDEKFYGAAEKLGFTDKDLQALDIYGNFTDKEDLRTFVASGGNYRTSYDDETYPSFTFSPQQEYVIRESTINWGGESHYGAYFLEDVKNNTVKVIDNDYWPLTIGLNPVFIGEDKFVCYGLDNAGLFSAKDGGLIKHLFTTQGRETEYIRDVYNNKRDKNIVVSYCLRPGDWEDETKYTLLFFDYDGNLIKTLETELPASFSQAGLYGPDFETFEGVHPDGKLVAKYHRNIFYILDLTTGQTEKYQYAADVMNNI